MITNTGFCKTCNGTMQVTVKEKKREIGYPYPCMECNAGFGPTGLELTDEGEALAQFIVRIIRVERDFKKRTGL